MPIEGLPTEGTPAGDAPGTPAATPAPTPDAAGNNTAATPQPGTGTEPQPTQATTEKTFTQADVDRILAQRLPKAVKAELKKMSGEGEGQPSVEDLQRQLSDSTARIRSFEARETVGEYLSDGRNKLNVRPENIRGIQELVIPRLEYGEDGKPTNVKEAIEQARSIAPTLFGNSASNINANAGIGNGTAPASMNDLIRRSAGIGT